MAQPSCRHLSPRSPFAPRSPSRPPSHLPSLHRPSCLRGRILSSGSTRPSPWTRMPESGCGAAPDGAAPQPRARIGLLVLAPLHVRASIVVWRGSGGWNLGGHGECRRRERGRGRRDGAAPSVGALHTRPSFRGVRRGVHKHRLFSVFSSLCPFPHGVGILVYRERGP